MKHNCNGCRALNIDRCYCTCELGYPIAKEVVNRQLMIYKYKPAEECPKPKTYDDLIKARKR